MRYVEHHWVPAPFYDAGRGTTQVAIKLVVLLLAAMVTCPLQLPGGVAGLRTTEFVNIAASAALVLALLSGSAVHRAAVPLSIAALLTIPWIWAEFISISMMVGSSPPRYALARWILGLATAYWIVVLMNDDRYRRIVGTGFILGLLLSLATVGYDAMTFDPTVPLVLTPDEEDNLASRWGQDGAYRAAGIFLHPNAAASVGLLLVPLVIGLVEERRLPRATLILAALAVGFVFVTTQTRGASGVATALLLWSLLRGSAARKAVMAVVLLQILGVGSLLGLLPLDAVLDRFSDTTAATENLSGRFATTIGSFELAIANPLGLGSRYLTLLYDLTGFSSTHNAYMQLALLGGLPLAIYVTARLLLQAFAPTVPTRVTESWVATYMAGVFFFENLFFSQTIILFTLWLLYRPVRHQE